MNGREGGFFSRDITRPMDGRWTFQDDTAKLNIGDTLYYWTYVDYDDGERVLGYTRDDQNYTVTSKLLYVCYAMQYKIFAKLSTALL